jgi:hypothetical protein
MYNNLNYKTNKGKVWFGRRELLYYYLATDWNNLTTWACLVNWKSSQIYMLDAGISLERINTINVGLSVQIGIY